jgi:hypothetical protein
MITRVISPTFWFVCDRMEVMEDGNFIPLIIERCYKVPVVPPKNPSASIVVFDHERAAKEFQEFCRGESQGWTLRELSLPELTGFLIRHSARYARVVINPEVGRPIEDVFSTHEFITFLQLVGEDVAEFQSAREMVFKRA